MGAAEITRIMREKEMTARFVAKEAVRQWFDHRGMEIDSRTFKGARLRDTDKVYLHWLRGGSDGGG